MNSLRKLRSKLQYTGPVFEVNVGDEFKVVTIGSHGVPVSNCMAYDQLHALLAISPRKTDESGVGNQTIQIYGGNGLQAALPPYHPYNSAAPSPTSTSSSNLASFPGHTAEIIFLSFIPQSSTLISIDRTNVMLLWSLSNFFPIKRAEFHQPITKIFHSFGSNFLYIGTSNGALHVFDVDDFSLCSYTIPVEQTIKSMQPIIDIASNPVDDSELLIGYLGGQVVLWDLLKKTAIRNFSILPKKNLTSLSWHSSGSQFSCGYDDGEIVFWSVKQEDPVFRIYVTQGEGKRFPIKKISFHRDGGLFNDKKPSNIVVSGGMLDYEPNGLILLKGEGYKEKTFLPLETECTDFFLIYSDPFPDTKVAPSGILTMEPQRVLIHDPTFQGAISRSLNPGLCNPRVLSVSNVSSCPHSIYKAMVFFNNQDPDHLEDAKLDFVNGGIIHVDPTSSSYYSIIATGHEEGVLRFYEISDTFLMHLCTIRLHNFGNVAPYSSITSLQLISFGSSHFCIVGCAKGQVLGFELSIGGIELGFSYTIHTSPVVLLSVEANNTLVSGDKSSMIAMFDLKRKKLITNIRLHDEPSDVVCVDSFLLPEHKNGSAGVVKIGETIHLYCGLKSGRIVVVDVEKLEVKTHFIAKKPSTMHHLSAYDCEWQLLRNVTKDSPTFQALRSLPDSADITFPLLTVDQNHIRIYSLPDNVYLSKAISSNVTHSIQGAYIKLIRGALFVIAFLQTHQDDMIAIYSLPDLRIVYQEVLDFKISGALHCQVPDENSIVMLTSSGEIYKLRLLVTGTSKSRTSKSIFIDPSIKMPKRKFKNQVMSSVSNASASIKGKFGKKALSRVFSKKEKKSKSTKDEEHSDEENSSPSNSQTNANLTNKNSSDSVNTSDLRELFGKKTNGLDVNNKVVITTDPYAVLLESLNLRGEKLAILSNKTNQMASDAKEMYEKSQETRK